MSNQPETNSSASSNNETILEEAIRITTNNREVDYGHPYYNMTTTALFWSAVLGIEVTPEQVALCQIGTKLAREIHKQKRDNIVDIAGYARVYERVVEKRVELAESPQPISSVNEPSLKFKCGRCGHSDHSGQMCNAQEALDPGTSICDCDGSSTFITIVRTLPPDLKDLPRPICIKCGYEAHPGLCTSDIIRSIQGEVCDSCGHKNHGVIVCPEVIDRPDKKDQKTYCNCRGLE